MTAVALPRTVSRPAPRATHRIRLSADFLGAPEIRILAAISLGLYLTVAVWLKDSLHYNIGDSVARSADAVYVALSRDPHLAAIGFYWPPLFSFLQIPFVILLKPFGRMDLAGPSVSALCMAGTIIVLGRFGHYLGVGRLATAVIAACFAFNPLMVFYAANGMSESSSFFFLALATFAFVKYCRTRRSMDLALLALALAAIPMIRIEATAFAATIAVIAGYQHPELKKSLIRAALIVAPATYTFLLWMGVQWVLLKDPLWFLHNTGQGAGAPRTGKALARFDLPSAADKFAVAHWVVGYFWFFGPALVLVIVACAVVRKWETVREGLGIFAVGAVFAGVQVVLRLKGQGFNDPRYFTPIAVAAALGAVWAVSKLPRPEAGPQPARIWKYGMVVAAVALLAFGDLNASVAEDSPTRAGVVREDVFFSRVLGSPHGNGNAGEWVAWHRLDDRLDPLLTGDHKVICDVEWAFAAVLYSKHPNHFIIVNDRDFQKIYADPAGKFDYVITAAPQGSPTDTMAALLTPPDDWKLTGTFGESGSGSDAASIYLYHQVGTQTPPGRAGGTVG